MSNVGRRGLSETDSVFDGSRIIDVASHIKGTE